MLATSKRWPLNENGSGSGGKAAAGGVQGAGSAGRRGGGRGALSRRQGVSALGAATRPAPPLAAWLLRPRGRSCRDRVAGATGKCRRLGSEERQMPGGESYPLALHSLSPRGRRYRAHQLGGTLDEGRVRYLCGRRRERTKALALRHVFPLGD